MSTLPYKTSGHRRTGNCVDPMPETLGDPKRDLRWVTSKNVKKQLPDRRYSVIRCYDLRERTLEGKARVVSKVYDLASVVAWVNGGHAMLASVAFGGVDL